MNVNLQPGPIGSADFGNSKLDDKGLNEDFQRWLDGAARRVRHRKGSNGWRTIAMSGGQWQRNFYKVGGHYTSRY